MAARAAVLGDTGESGPGHWEKPLGTPEVHVVFAAVATDAGALAARLARALDAIRAVPGLAAIWRQDCELLPDGKEAFGYLDGISQPAIEGSGIPGTNPREPPLKGGRARPRPSRRAGRPHPDAAARDPGSQRDLRRPAQAAPARRRLPAVPEGERRDPRGGGDARRQDDGALAERRAPGALPDGGRRRAGRRPGAQQRLPLRRRPEGLQDAPRRARPAREPARRPRGRGHGADPPHAAAPHELRPAAAGGRAGRTTASTGA